MSTVIIGGGIVGLCIAYRLQKDGHEVTLLESADYSALENGELGEAPSYGNAALVTNVLSFPVPEPGGVSMGIKSFFSTHSPISIVPGLSPRYLLFLLRVALATRPSAFAKGTIAQDTLSEITFESFDDLLADGISCEFHENGSIHAFETREELEAAKELFHHYPQLEGRIRFIESTEELQELDPKISSDYHYGYFAPGDRQVEPASLMASLLARIKEKGGKVLTHTPVTGFVKKGDTVTGVITDHAVIDADTVVIAAGVGSRELTAQLGYAVPVYGGGGYSIDFSAPEGERPLHSVMTGRTHIAVTPLDRGFRASSGMMVGQPSPSVSARREKLLLDDIAQLFPSLPLENRSPIWSGLRPFSADGVPIIGVLPKTRNAYVATGHTMLGLTYGPATAQIISELLSGEPYPSSYELLSPARFGPIAL